jgi:catechol 2,3-dioxygenase-like lactoylglutathione lyase family enzyme
VRFYAESAAGLTPEPARLLLHPSHSVPEDSMIAHTTLSVGDYRKAKAFYIEALAPLGYKNNMEYGESAGFNDGKNTDFWITAEKSVVPTHLAFEASSQKQVEAFYKAALKAGAKDNGKPGYRDYSPGYYAAFVLDADGNNIEAVWYDPSKE